MSIDKQTVTKSARLARLHIEDDQKDAIAEKLNAIMGWIEQLQEVDTDGVEPMTGVTDMKLFLREDEITDGDKQDDILANAPETAEGFFVVPKVVE